MRTLATPATIEVEIKRSRFIAHAARVDSLEETLAFYERVADPSANHNCWAWRLDHQYRFNDDGEPASTAGKPIYSAIDGRGLDHVMIVVTRFFGGIKLGVGGLVRAYSGSASQCLDRAGIIEIRPRREFILTAAFDWTGQVYAALDACKANKQREEYEPQGIRIEGDIAAADYERLKSLLRDSTRGEASIRPAG